MTHLRAICVAVLMGFLASTGSAQQSFPVFEESLPIAVLNRERLLNGSDFGRAILNRMRETQSRLVEENDRLQAKLEAEELELTELRKTMTSEEFAPLAAAFDAKANEIRRTQSAKAREFDEELEAVRFSFFRRIEGIIKDLMIERDISFLLNDQAVLLSVSEGDITDDVIARINAAFASGELQDSDE